MGGRPCRRVRARSCLGPSPEGLQHSALQYLYGHRSGGIRDTAPLWWPYELLIKTGQDFDVDLDKCPRTELGQGDTVP